MRGGIIMKGGVVGAQTIGNISSKLANFTVYLEPLKPIMAKISNSVIYICLFMLIPAFPILIIMFILFHFSGRFFYNIRQL